MRIGWHTGKFVEEMDDFLGKNIILASHIADQVSGGQSLVSALLKTVLFSASVDLLAGKSTLS